MSALLDSLAADFQGDVSQRVALEQINEAFEALKQGAVARSVIVFDTAA